MAYQILVIEDEQEIRENLCYILELQNYEVISAENGLKGVESARKYIPDLIISDIIMPELDGYGVIKEIYNDVTTAGVPFIFLTAKADLKDIRAGMLLGADDYIVKPFQMEELIGAVKIRLEKHRKIKNLYNPEPASKRLKYDDRIFLNVKNTPKFLKVNEIKFI